MLRLLLLRFPRRGSCWRRIPPTAGIPPPVLGQEQDVSDLSALLKKIMPSVVIFATKGRAIPGGNPLFEDPILREFFGLPEMPAERETYSTGSVIVDAERGFMPHERE